MESLSPDLSQQLRSLGLCTPRDQMRCRARVRRMSRDLPAFDSVWIDALVQLGKLTPYQAKVCMAGGPALLAVGPFVLNERVASDGRLETFIARQPGAATLYELTQLHSPAGDDAAPLERLQQSTQSLRTIRIPQVVVATAVQRVDDRLVAVAPWVGGKSLAELLVRRGRFPILVVTEIARQLTVGLERLERADVLHGDLRLRTVRLDSDGRLFVTQPGLLAALEPTITIHTEIPADAYDGIAPELIDTRAQRSTSSELYAFGCLLWQLLAGRPPFPAGDPLVKLAAHQTRRVADVRQWSPDVPTSLAELLLALTHPDPRQRPRNFTEVATRLGRPSHHASQTLRRFARAFQSAAPRITSPDEPATSHTKSMVVGLMLLCAVVLGSWMHGGVRSELLRMTQPLRAAVQSGSSASAPLDLATSGGAPIETIESPPVPLPAAPLLPLPEPQQGMVRLATAGPYRASKISAVGNLTIAGDAAVQPVIVVDRDPLQVSGVTVVLQNVSIVRSSSADAPQPLLNVTAQDFGLVDCLLDGGVASPSTATRSEADSLVRWQPLQAESATGGRIGWVNTVLTGPGHGLACVQSPASLQLQNVLHLGTGCLLRLPEQSSPRPLPITLKRTTLRGAGLLSLEADPKHRPSAVAMIAERCLFDLPSTGGLLELRGIAPHAALQEAVLACRLTGVESFLQTGTPLAAQSVPGVGRQPVDTTAMPIEGLQYSTIRFDGPASAGWRSSAVEREWARLAGAQSPGCDLTAFARFPPVPYNSATVERSSRTVVQ